MPAVATANPPAAVAAAANPPAAEVATANPVYSPAAEVAPSPPQPAVLSPAAAVAQTANLDNAAPAAPPQTAARHVQTRAPEASRPPIPAPAAPTAPMPHTANQPAEGVAPSYPSTWSSVPAPAPSTLPTPADAGVTEARDRLARLRARLESSERRWQATAPEATATRVRETVGTLRNRLEDGEAERRRLLEALAEAERAQADAERGRQTADDALRRAQALADERAQVAQAALTESEALAEERDGAMARVAEFQELSQQQAGLLDEMENRLHQQAEAMSEALNQTEALRAALDATQADLDAAMRQVDDLTRIRQSLVAQVESLQTELTRANQAKDALAEIQKLVDGVG